MVTKAKQLSLVVCLFLFLFVVIGGSLHLNPGGAFLAAATGTPLIIHLLHRTCAMKNHEQNSPFSTPSPRSPRCDIEIDASRPNAVESEPSVRQ
jgi:hypothetical protein